MVFGKVVSMIESTFFSIECEIGLVAHGHESNRSACQWLWSGVVLTESLAMPEAVVLSVVMGVGGWG